MEVVNIEKIDINTESYIIVNVSMGCVLSDSINYISNNFNSSITGLLYPIGMVGKCHVYVDPYMMYTDTRILKFDGKVDIEFDNTLLEDYNKAVFNIILPKDDSRIIDVKDDMNYLA